LLIFFLTHYSIQEFKEDKMGMACSTYRRDVNFVEKSYGRLLGRTIYRCDNNIKMG
jgi:hypothetical protein